MTQNVTLALDFNGVIEVTPPSGPWVYLEATRSVPTALGVNAPSADWFRAHYGMKDKPWWGFIVELMAHEVSAPSMRGDESFTVWATTFLADYADRFAPAAAAWLEGYNASPQPTILGDSSSSPDLYFQAGHATETFVTGESAGATFLAFVELVYQANTAHLYAANGLPHLNPSVEQLLNTIADNEAINLTTDIVSTENEARIRATLAAHDMLSYFRNIHGSKVNKAETLTALADEAQGADGLVIFVDDQVNGIGHGLAAATTCTNLLVAHVAGGLHDESTVIDQLGYEGWIEIDDVSELVDVIADVNGTAGQN